MHGEGAPLHPCCTTLHAGRSVRVVCKAGDKVLVCGAQNQTAARIALQLAKSGYKVTAGERRRRGRAAPRPTPALRRGGHRCWNLLEDKSAPAPRLGS